MDSYGHEFFKTVSDSCFRVSFISGSESHGNSSFIFSMSAKFFMTLGIA